MGVVLWFGFVWLFLIMFEVDWFGLVVFVWVGGVLLFCFGCGVWCTLWLRCFGFYVCCFVCWMGCYAECFVSFGCWLCGLVVFMFWLWWV